MYKKAEPVNLFPTLPPAPRHVPRITVLWLYSTGLSFFGWFCFVFATIIFWVAARHATPFSPERPVSGNLPVIVTEAAITRVAPHAAYHFTYTVSGKEYSSISYGSSDSLKAGDSVRIDYVRDMPTTGRIIGMNSKRVGDGVIFTFAIVMLFGLLFLRLQWWSFRTDIKLLEHGVFGVAIRDKMRFEEGSDDSEDKWHSYYHFIPYPGHWLELHAWSTDKNHYHDEEPVIFLADRPKRNRILKSFSLPLTFDTHGNHVVGKGISFIVACILHSALILLNLYFFLVAVFE